MAYASPGKTGWAILLNQKRMVPSQGCKPSLIKQGSQKKKFTATGLNLGFVFVNGDKSVHREERKK